MMSYQCLIKSQINVCRGRTLAGEANFSMGRTGQTEGLVLLIEYPPNIEKGLCQRFLWIA